MKWMELVYDLNPPDFLAVKEETGQEKKKGRKCAWNEAFWL